MLSITKLQKLKAIHNSNASTATTSPVVINHKTTKIESNSQRNRVDIRTVFVVINHKTTKFESNSQLVTACDNRQQRCYQSQNYKF